MPSEEELDFDDGDINTTEIGDIDADDNLYDFGLIEDESQVLTQEEGVSDLAFIRDIFPKVFGSQWSEIIPQTNQPALIEGRTLLGMIMDNVLMDWKHGGQTLHLIYCLEVLLHKLRSKGWDVIVTFFSVLPYDFSTSPEKKAAVEILMQHLRSCSLFSDKTNETSPSLKIVEFENWWDDKWRNFVIENHPSFMILDLPQEHLEEEQLPKLTYEDVQKTFLLGMIAQNIRAISSDFRITSTIWSFELTLRLPFDTDCLNSIHNELNEGNLFNISNNSDNNESLNFDNIISNIDDSLSITDKIIILTLSQILSNDKSYIDLCKNFIICNFITRVTPLEVRLQKKQVLDIPENDCERINNFFKLFSNSIYPVIKFLISSKDPISINDMVKVSDLIDGRLFYAIYSKICYENNGTLSSENTGLNNSSLELIESLWKSILNSSNNNNNECLFPLSISTNIDKIKSHIDSQKKLLSSEELSNDDNNISSCFVDISNEFANDMEINEIENIIRENNLALSEDKYSTFVKNENIEELPYYHADEPEPEPEPVVPERKTRREKKRERKQRQQYYNYTEKVAESLSGKGTAIHHIVSARSDAITLQSVKEEIENKQKQEEQEEQEESKNTKGGKGSKKGGAKKKQPQKGNKGGKGKKGHINRKEQILAKNKERLLQNDKNIIQSAISFADEEENTKDKIFHLSKKLKELRGKAVDSALIEGYMKLIEWSMIQWREQCVIIDNEDDIDEFEEVDEQFERNYEGAIQAFRISYDTVQLFTEHITPADIRKIQQVFHVLGLASACKEIYEFYVLKHPDKVKDARYRAKKLTPLEKAQSLNMTFAQFQLLHCGHLMQRSFNSKPDPRVIGFKPDAWQRELLDIVDSKQSALVVAPTSSGKTFISYYTMKQVIEENKKSKYASKAQLVIYIAPTKALVRQVAAEVYAHYGPIVGIQTTSYEQSTDSCQILVTVPQCLEELLLDPKWNSRKIAYCILDEIHCIQEFGTGEQTMDEGGSIVWEHVINLLPCPFLALSATIGNPECFRNWLSFSQKRYNREVRVVTHKYRWADLKLQVYTPDLNDDSITNITNTTQGPNIKSLNHLHPVASLTLLNLQQTDSLHHLRLSPEECYQLYYLFYNLSPDNFKDELKELNPENYFKGLILRYEVFKYESELKEVILNWSRDNENEEKVNTIQKILDELSGDIHSKDSEYPNSSQFCYEYFLSLLVELHNDEKLPALVFSLDRHRCNKLVTELVLKLEDLETKETQKPDYQRRLREYSKNASKKEKKSKRQRDKVEKEAKHAADAVDDISSLEMELPGKDERFSFLRKGEGAHSDDKEFWLKRIPQTSEFIRILTSGLERGIGVHHGALPSSYRTAVEVLFRGGHLKVVISTGTLSLGINMPCKTVVFAGDSHALTPLSFQQMSGRAGRRGYDDYGNIVFFGISQYRVFSLLCARLTTLTGGQPITPTVSLRLLNCYYQTDKSERTQVAERLRGLLSPSLYSTNLPEKEAIIHRFHSRWLFRIYVDILIRLPMLEKNSLFPTNIASLAMKLFNTEPSNLLISFFFLSDAIGDIGSQIDNQQVRLNDLFLVLCHIFRPIPVTSYLASLITQTDESSSLIVLPKMKENHSELLKEYNRNVIKHFVKCTLSAHEINNTVSEYENILPYSDISIGSNNNNEELNNNNSNNNTLLNQLKESSSKLVIRSPFVALSGHNDEFETAQELADTCNLALPIELDQIPSSTLQDIRGNHMRLNAYAWDFLKHGNRKSLVHENGFKEANAWELIRDWDEILEKLTTYLSVLPKDDDRVKRVRLLFDFLRTDFHDKFERFNS